MEIVLRVTSAVAATRRRAVSWRRGAVALLVLLVAALSIQLETDWGGNDVGAFFDNVVYEVIPLLAALVCVLHRSEAKHERRAWILLGIGLAAWGFGDIYYSVAFADLPESEIPFPSPADVGYLAFYPPVFVGLGLLVRSQLVRFARTSWLDGVIAGLTVGAIAAALVFHPVLASSGGDAAAVGTNLAYPLADMLLIALVVGALGLGGRRVSSTWLLLSAGLGCFAIADSVYLVRVANGTYEYGTADLGWLAGMALIALASVVRPAGATASTDVGSLPFVPATFAVAGIGILTYDHFARVDLLSLLLAAAGLLAVVVRMTLSLLENSRMLKASRQEAETDALSGLRNRRKLQSDLAERIAGGGARSSVLLMFDLDGFKGYNDSFGHPAGDALLVRLAGRLDRVAGSAGTAYRLGGDEFCLLVDGGFADIPRLRERAYAALSEDGDGFSIRSSCGAAVLPDEAPTAADALRLADIRMYEHKSSRPSAGKQTMSALLSALEERDPALADHTGQVTRLVTEVAQALGLGRDVVERVALAAQLHDIGKIAIPESIISKPAKLTEAEWDFVRRHTLIGERIVSAAPALASVGELVRSSHERWDGTGYPDALRGEEIPLGARIIFACDSYDAMTSDRPYARAMTPAEALTELADHAGTQFDPVIVDALLGVLERRRLQNAA
jgi:two-component system, cell cycle response regulator